MTLASSANTDAASAADGSASQGADATIGAAVAITLANVTNRATVPAGVSITAQNLAVAATVTVDGADTTATFGAQSVAGAGGGDVSVAGSFALAVVNHTTRAGLDGTVTLTGGDATLTAASVVSSTVKALPAGAGVTDAGDFGFGASVALNLITDRTGAEIADGGTLTGGRDVTLAATATDAAVTEARMGAAGGDVALSPGRRGHPVECHHVDPDRNRRSDAVGLALGHGDAEGDGRDDRVGRGARCRGRGDRPGPGADDREPHGDL